MADNIIPFSRRTKDEDPCGKYILNDQGLPVPEPDVLKWAQWFDGDDHRLVKQTKIGRVSVSTVFLGIDHGWDNEEPILWETMVFGGIHDQSQWRYSSREAAVLEHVCIVASISKRRYSEFFIYLWQRLKRRKK